MKNKLSFIIILFIAILSSTVAKADYVSKAVVGNYEDSNVWNHRGWSPVTPAGTSSPDDRIEIVKNAEITKDGNFNPVELSVSGIFILNGDALDEFLILGLESLHRQYLLPPIIGDLDAGVHIHIEGTLYGIQGHYPKDEESNEHGGKGKCRDPPFSLFLFLLLSCYIVMGLHFWNGLVFYFFQQMDGCFLYGIGYMFF